MKYDSRIEIRISKATKHQIKKLAESNKRKPSEMARLLIEDALDNTKRKARIKS